MKIVRNKRKGLMVIVLAAGLCFIGIVFASLIQRMRQESAITNRVSINERLNQLASAVGRFSIRKLQRDIEQWDIDNGEEIIKSIFTDKKTGVIVRKNFTEVIEHIEVIDSLKKEFKKKWGDQGTLSTFVVEYEIVAGGLEDFDPPIIGLKNNEFERKGHIDIIITVGIDYGVKRKYTVRKEFLLTRLLAPPFYRFTLFSHNGANIKENEANSIAYDQTGKIDSSSNKIPLVCINVLQSDKPETYKFNGNYDNFFLKDDPKAFIKNGWIYLGGSGYATDFDKNQNNLILNVVPGLGDDEFESKFGEFFHFYFDSQSSGWLMLKNWSDWLKSNIEGNSSGLISMVFVDYGFYKGLLDIQYAPEKLYKYFLFKFNVLYSYKKGTDYAEDLTKGSSMHLFGTPNHCTPTLIFGQVKRRYLRCFGLYDSEVKKVLPLRDITKKGSDSNVLKLYNTDMFLWHENSHEGFTNSQISLYAISNAFNDNFAKNKNENVQADIYYNGIDSMNLVGIGPKVIDTEPYMKGLQNIAAPKNPELDWKNAVKATEYCINDPDELCKDDFNFNNDEELNYKGSIQSINIDYNKYLNDRTTFTLGNPNETISIKKNEFIQKHFFTNEDEKEFFLNQIIRIKGNLDIDEKLTVAKGGIIICDGKIKINEPIINKYLENKNSNADNPQCFGYLTLIAKEGIEISSSAGIKKSGDKLPIIHGFFIAGCGEDTTDAKVYCDTPMHIIGGVAADRIDNLVRSGGVIEWGFSRYECTDMNKAYFYGMTLGPRDIEIYTSE